MEQQKSSSNYQTTANDRADTGNYERLIEQWDKGFFDSPGASVEYHYRKHGKEVHAKSFEQYMCKAEGFTQNMKRAVKSFPADGTPDAVRYEKNKLFIIKNRDGKILSFGNTSSNEQCKQ